MVHNGPYKDVKSRNKDLKTTDPVMDSPHALHIPDPWCIVNTTENTEPSHPGVETLLCDSVSLAAVGPGRDLPSPLYSVRITRYSEITHIHLHSAGT